MNMNIVKHIRPIIRIDVKIEDNIMFIRGCLVILSLKDWILFDLQKDKMI